MQLNNLQLQFLARFGKSPEGQLFVQLLKLKMVDCDEKLRTATGEEVYRRQGRSLELSELLTDIEDAEAVMNRSRVISKYRPTGTAQELRSA
jgi:hypothetical protein